MKVGKSIVLLTCLITSGLLVCAMSTDEGRGIMDRGVGIHLGTTYSSVAVFKYPGPRTGVCSPRYEKCSALSNSDIMEVVRNERGSKTTPSCVAFTDDDDEGVVIGEAAKDQEPFNPNRTICGINRLLGKRFDDPDVQSYKETVPYRVLNKENKPHIEVEFKNGETKVFSPEEICAMILGKMKEIAEEYMGNKVELAVVTVHQSYFNDEVRGHIQEAGKMAGLNVVKVIDSRFVSTLSRELWVQDNFRVIIYNLGGSRFDVNLQERDRMGLFELIASKEDPQLGGETFDTRVVDYFIDLIKSKYNKEDISKDLKAVGKLRIECEKAKISLSSNDTVMVKIDSLTDGIVSFEEPLTRVKFEELNMDLFNKTIDLVEGVMKEAGVMKTGIDEIVVVGGNARIPKIQHMLKDVFGRERFLKDVNPDEALAFAATHMAGFYSGKQDDRFQLKVPNSLSVGIETVGGVITKYVPNCRYLPATSGGSRFVTTDHDGQTALDINIYEGERPLTKHSHYLGTLQITDLPPAPRGVQRIKVKVDVNLNGNIRVTAEHKASQQIKSVIIPAEQRYNTVEKINQTRSEYFQFYNEDVMEKTRLQEARRLGMPQRTI